MANDTSGIMALPAMDQQQGPGPEAQMVFESMRQNLPREEVSSELLNSASQVDPQAVAEFKAELEAMDIPPEVLDLLDRLVDEILANPGNYEEIKNKYRAQGVTEDILPEQFDPELFGALNLAIDQLRGAPAAPQAFAKGGIAELSPVAKAIAAQGRNGDTMLAHITPDEARMLKKQGGSGTINPATGLPEFANIFSRIGKAIKKFAGSTVGKLVIGTALFMVAGPMAANALLGTAGAAASPILSAGISGFVSGAGTTLLAGGNLRDALKAGAIGGITAGAMKGITTGFGPSGTEVTPTAGATQPSTLPTLPEQPVMAGAESFPVREPGTINFRPLDKYDLLPDSVGNTPMGMQGVAPQQAAVPSATPPAGAMPAPAPVAPPVATAPVMSQAPQPSIFDKTTDFLKKTFSPSEIAAQGEPAAREAANKVAAATARSLDPSLSQSVKDRIVQTAYNNAYSSAAPGVFAKYGPMAAAGVGIMGLAGGFKQQDVKSPYGDLFTGGPGSAEYLLRTRPRDFYIQNMRGVTYYDGSVLPPLPPPPPPGYAHGGEVQKFDVGGDVQPVIERIATEAAAGTPASSAAPQITRSTTPVGTPAATTTQVATPATGGYNLFSPAAQNMYYGALNQQLLSPATTPAQGIAALQFPTNERLAEVEDLYRTMLGRDPDVGGLRFYANPQTNFSRQVIAEDIARSPEYIQRQATARAPGTPTPVDPNSPAPDLLQRTNQIRDIYKQYLGRTPDEGGLQFYMNPQFSLDQIRQDIANSREAQVRGLYSSLLGREPDEGGLQFYMNPQFTMDQIRQDILGSDEYRRGQVRTTNPPPDDRRVVTAAPAPAPAPVSGPYAEEITKGREAIPYATGTAATRADIQQLYRDVLGREVDPGGLEFYFASQFSPEQIRQQLMASPEAMARTNPGTGGGPGRDVNDNVVLRASGGIASLNKGGYPRRTGQIDGPGTETSDSIPAMLSDGEFVMTAKAVRGAGKGDRRAGAKKMYALMHQLERNAARG